jgi:hypothetical protein
MSAATDAKFAYATTKRWGVRIGPAVAAFSASAVAFVSVQVTLTLHNLHVWSEIVARASARSPTSGQSLHAQSSLKPLVFVAAGSLAIFALFVTTELRIVERGHRVIWAVPAVAFVFFGVLISSGVPKAIGVPWIVGCFQVCATPWYLTPWSGALADLALVLIPGGIVAARTRSTHRRRELDAPAVAAVALCVALAVMVDRTSAVLGHSPVISGYVAAVAAGVCLGTARPWWPWLHVLFATAVSGALAWTLSGGGAPGLPSSPQGIDPGSILRTAGPLVVGVLLASAWEPVARTFRHVRRRPLSLLVAVNVLNVADALLTSFAIRSGSALELNPLIRYGGLPLKVVFVGALSWLLYRRRPSALVWPAIALLWVVLYHLNGLVLIRR